MPLTNNKQQATSNKQQATTNLTINYQSINPITHRFTLNNNYQSILLSYIGYSIFIPKQKATNHLAAIKFRQNNRELRAGYSTGTASSISMYFSTTSKVAV
ncbi:hypothetical protein BXY64_1074 [Marinifilum flexuosum]|uniref:Uncharacterized protein n=1 Tax=Marinifilum flexuosum TaxID=1117708 RepID=A0A419X908_9BACT|nr:hypothetical protein BXY64_1074 [Marinifilum flexuosum]